MSGTGEPQHRTHPAVAGLGLGVAHWGGPSPRAAGVGGGGGLAPNPGLLSLSGIPACMPGLRLTRGEENDQTRLHLRVSPPPPALPPCCHPRPGARMGGRHPGAANLGHCRARARDGAHPRRPRRLQGLLRLPVPVAEAPPAVLRQRPRPVAPIRCVCPGEGGACAPTLCAAFAACSRLVHQQLSCFFFVRATQRTWAFRCPRCYRGGGWPLL